MTGRPHRLAPASALIGVLAAAAVALAFTPAVDTSGGPLVLEERVAEALDAWRDAGLDVDASPRSARVRYGDPALLGPDVVVLIVTDPEPAFDLELLVHPDLVEDHPGALRYALGVALGGVPGEGALDPRQRAAAAPPPSADDVAAIAEARRDDPADIDGDGVVDFEDLLLLAASFGARGLNLPGDIDGDGAVDERDLELLRERYTFTPPRRTSAEEAAGDGDELPAVPAPAEPEDDAGTPTASDPEEGGPADGD